MREKMLDRRLSEYGTYEDLMEYALESMNFSDQALDMTLLARFAKFGSIGLRE